MFYFDITSSLKSFVYELVTIPVCHHVGVGEGEDCNMFPDFH